MITLYSTIRADRFSDRKAGHPNLPAAQMNLGTIIGNSIMKRIRLRHQQNLFTLVDDGDFEKLSKYKWCLDKKNNVYTSVRIGIDGKGKVVRRNITMPQMILKTQGTGYVTDHKNHNRLDNQRHNLRACSVAQNSQNRKPNKNQKHKGVTFAYGKYRVRVQAFGKRKQIGIFTTIEDAKKAYNEAVKAMHGEYAYYI